MNATDVLAALLDGDVRRRMLVRRALDRRSLTDYLAECQR